MISPLLRWFSVASLLVAVSGTLATAAQDLENEQTWVWVAPRDPEPARHLEMAVSLLEPVAESGLARFECDIDSNLAFRGAQVGLTVRDSEGTMISGGVLPLDITSGSNSCQITLDTSALELGTYEATFQISHTLLLDEPSHVIVLRKVSAGKLLADLGAFGTQMAELDTALDEAETAGRANPYLRLKANIVADVLLQARENAGNAAWETLEEQLRYIQTRLDAIRAGLVFEDVLPELAGTITAPPLVNARIGEGAFSANGRPVYLFGGALPAWEPELVARLARYNLNAAVVTLGPYSASQPGYKADIQNFFDATADHNVAVAVQLEPRQLPPAMFDAHPELRHGDMVDLSQPVLLEEWEAFIREVGPLFTDRPMLLGISVVNDPQFRFDGAEVKEGFLEFLRANYPDRLTLNRSWRAHLATLEDIVPWSTNPYDNYQQHRPFQFDWQTYHQSLGNRYVNWSRSLVASHIPDMPLMATLENNVFQKAETRYGVNREQLANMLQISGCSAASSIEDPVYSMSYPAESAYYTLLRSFEPDQPVFNLEYQLDPGLDAGGDLVFRYVHSAVWESVMSGLNAATVPMDSLIFLQPHALEGFATAALDVNRLAPIVHAFQTAPTDVGILFSYASKVFDDGEPHLLSAKNAYEGVSFGGYNVRFISEDQCASGGLDDLKILVLPDTPAMSDEAFRNISAFVENGGTVARTGAPSPYNERGYSRGDLIRNTGNTVLVRGLNLPTEYLHAMDAATVLGALPQIPRPVTSQGYPVEGVKSRYVKLEGEEYLYVVNIRKEPVYCTLATPTRRGRDLLRGKDVEFPMTLQPLEPMLLRLEPVHLEMTVTAKTAGGE